MNITFPDSTCKVLRNQDGRVLVNWKAKNEFVIWTLIELGPGEYAVENGLYFDNAELSLKQFELIIGSSLQPKPSDFRDFDEEDFFSFADARNFKDGTKPQVAYFGQWYVVMDGQGIEVGVHDDDGNQSTWSDTFDYSDDHLASNPNILMFHACEVMFNFTKLDKSGWLTRIDGEVLESGSAASHMRNV